jgi:hypothetical protein
MIRKEIARRYFKDGNQEVGALFCAPNIMEQILMQATPLIDRWAPMVYRKIIIS